MTSGSASWPSHDKSTAADFLATLDQGATKFTFQFFSDYGEHPAEVLHCSLDDAWPKIQAINTPERCVGVFVTINETDFKDIPDLKLVVLKLP